MCDEACDRLQVMEKCSARLFTDIFRKRERKYASKLLYEEYHTMERVHETAMVTTSTVASEMTTKEIKVPSMSPLITKIQGLFR